MTFEVIFLDTNVVIAALDPKDLYHQAAVAFLEAHASDPLVLPAAVYAEVLAVPRAGLVKEFLDAYRLRPVFAGLESPEVWELAAERFARYAENRRKSGKQGPRRILADFLIGAQALVQPDTDYVPALATLDVRFFKIYFSELKIYNLLALDG